MSATPQAVQQGMQVAPTGEPNPPPAPSPLQQPQQDKGSTLVSHVNIQTAMLLLQHALPGYGLGSKEGKALLEVLKRLGTEFGDPTPSKELVPAQIKQLVQGMQTGNPVAVPVPPQ